MLGAKQERRAVVLTSGGMDSTVLAYWAMNEGYQVSPVFIDYGQHFAEMELTTVLSVLPSSIREGLHTLTIRGVFERSPSLLVRAVDLWQEDVTADDLYLPYRNMLLLSIGAAHAASIGADVLMAAFINSNHALETDATSAFLAGASGLVGKIGPVTIELPFRTMEKSEVAQLGQKLCVPIAYTYSCQVNARVHCGSCPNCVDRLDALRSVRGASEGR